MDIERGFIRTLEKLDNKAADSLEAAAKLLRAGSRIEAIAMLNIATADITRGSDLDNLRLSTIGKLNELGIEQASSESTLIVKQEIPTPISPESQPKEEVVVVNPSRQPTTETVVLPRQETVVQGKGKETKNPDFASRQESVARALFTVEGEENKPAPWRSIVSVAYSDVLDNIADENLKRKKEQETIAQSIDICQVIAPKLARYAAAENPEKTMPKIADFLSYVRTRPGLEQATIHDIKDVIDRKLSLAGLRQRLATVPQETKTATQRREKEVKSMDFDSRHESVARAFFTIEGEENKPILWKTVVNYAFSDMLDGIQDEKAKKKKETELIANCIHIRNAVVDRLDRFVKSADPEKTFPKVAEFLLYVKEKPGLGNAGIDDMKAIIKRELTLEGLRRKLQSAQLAKEGKAEVKEEKKEADPRLTGSEICLLAQTLRQINPAKLQEAGIKIHADDQKGIEAIAEKLGNAPELAKRASSAGDALLTKLAMFLKDKRAVFLANIENEDAQFLLTIFATVESEDKIKKLFTQ